MDPILSRCGYRCDLCLAYEPNLAQNPQNAVLLSNGWFKYFGFRIPPEKILCPGCLSIDGQLIDQDCPVRPCVINHGLPTCASCGEYICSSLEERIVIYETIEQNTSYSIPSEDRDSFILPYENKSRLDKLRHMP